jgi:hypothetical protein
MRCPGAYPFHPVRVEKSPNHGLRNPQSSTRLVERHRRVLGQRKQLRKKLLTVPRTLPFVVAQMGRLARKQPKILRRIIGLVFVLVVNDLSAEKVASENRLSDQAVLKNIPTWPRRRMVRCPLKHVPLTMKGRGTHISTRESADL